MKSDLALIQNLFDTRKLLSKSHGVSEVSRYYKTNRLPLSFIPHGFVHLGISYDGKYKNSDLFEQANLVNNYIQMLKGAHPAVLELATGRGANSFYLAIQNPKVQFIGLDLPIGQIDFARKRAKKVKNFKVLPGDFHNLRQFQASSFDLVFIVEALCHSDNKIQVIKEVNRVLKKDGTFIIIDFYTARNLKQLTPDQILAKKLVARGMAFDDFAQYDEVKKDLVKNGFKIAREEIFSENILPSLRFVRRKAARFLSFPKFIQKSFIKIMPSEFTNNIITGFLFEKLVKDGVCNYTMLVVQKT